MHIHVHTRMETEICRNVCHYICTRVQTRLEYTCVHMHVTFPTGRPEDRLVWGAAPCVAGRPRLSPDAPSALCPQPA